MKVVFLDRDGVINVDYGYVYQWDKFEFISGAIEAMKLIVNSGYSIIIITNQSGIARGFYTQEEYTKLEEQICNHLKENGVEILATYHCPHHTSGVIEEYSRECLCRKPKPGMIIEALTKYDIDIKNSILVGDKESDIKAGIAAGIGQLYFVNNKVSLSKNQADNAFSFPDLFSAINFAFNTKL